MRVCMLGYSFDELDGRVRQYARALVERGDKEISSVCGRKGNLRRTLSKESGYFVCNGASSMRKVRLRICLGCCGFWQVHRCCCRASISVIDTI